ncbi:MAG: redoxin domain-containing protein [Ignavibacteriales bacterium]|nr:redoxin domain-containing protein [Ignavibacteriales bacterium]
MKKIFLTVFFLSITIVCYSQETINLHKPKENPFKYEWEQFDLLFDSSYVHTWLENGWINIEQISKSNKLIWRTVLAKGDLQNKPIIIKSKTLIEINDATKKYFIRAEASINRIPFIVLRGLIQDDISENEGFDPTEYNLNFVYSKVINEEKGFQEWEYAGWKYIGFGKNDNPKTNGIFRLDHYNYTDETDFRSGLSNNSVFIWEDKHFYYDKGFLYAELLSDAYVNSTASLEECPNFTIEKWYNSDKGITKNELKGKLSIVYFWRANCWITTYPLVKLNYLHEKYSKDGLRVIGIHENKRKDLLEKYLLENPDIIFPIGFDSGKTKVDFEVDSSPFFFIIDGKGKIIKMLKFIPSEEQVKKLLFNLDK